jgi:hypothetical protein
LIPFSTIERGIALQSNLAVVDSRGAFMLEITLNILAMPFHTRIHF